MEKTLSILILLLALMPKAFAQESEGSTATFGRGGAGLTVSSDGSSDAGETITADEFSGAATYRIKLPTPPSKSGLEPQLILNYNSHRKNLNSPVGMGWELDLGTINRKADGDIGRINYTGNKDFEVRFGGQSETLVLRRTNVSISTYNITNDPSIVADEYEAKINTSFNVYYHLKQVDPNNQLIQDHGWVALDKSGRKFFFGTTGNSRLAATDGRRVARWYLHQARDTNSNTMTVTYDLSHKIDLVAYDGIVIQFFYENNHPFFPSF